MTKNVIDYYKYLEDRRHNESVEQETARANRAGERIKENTLSETIRHDYVTEGQNLIGLKETERSNRAREAETAKHNRATEYEERRSNMAKEQENNRSNLAKERETHRANVVHEGILTDQLAETVTHNRNVEDETNRANEAHETLTEKAQHETSLHNRINEITSGVKVVGDLALGIVNAKSSMIGAKASMIRALKSK